MVKLVIDARSNEILGGHILEPHADLLIHQVLSPCTITAP